MNSALNYGFFIEFKKRKSTYKEPSLRGTFTIKNEVLINAAGNYFISDYFSIELINYYN